MKTETMQIPCSCKIRFIATPTPHDFAVEHCKLHREAPTALDGCVKALEAMTGGFLTHIVYNPHGGNPTRFYEIMSAARTALAAAKKTKAENNS